MLTTSRVNELSMSEPVGKYKMQTPKRQNRTRGPGIRGDSERSWWLFQAVLGAILRLYERRYGHVQLPKKK